VTHGYDIFDKKEEDCVKVVLKPWEQQKPTENKEPVKIEN
jgi:S-(hydroxymethyl)glutathione dehydrogenase/alcohol dehydrogenase